MQPLLISPRAILLFKDLSVPLSLANAEIMGLRPWPCDCCPFIVIRSAKRSAEVMNDMKKVHGDWAFTVQEVKAFKGSLKKSGSKLTEFGNKSIALAEEYGYKSPHGHRAHLHGRQSCWQLPGRQTTLVSHSPLITKYLKSGRVLMVSIVYAWPVLAVLRCWWTLCETG